MSEQKNTPDHTQEQGDARRDSQRLSPAAFELLREHIERIERVRNAQMRTVVENMRLNAEIRRALGPNAAALQSFPPDFQELFDALSRASDDPPTDLRDALEKLPPVGTLPSPGATWLLLTLFRYRERQQWAKGVLLELLPNYFPIPLEDLDSWVPGHMYVPGMPEWEVELSRCSYSGTLTNRVTGESISVSRLVGDGENVFFPTEFPKCLGPSSSRDPAARFLELHPLYGLEDTIYDLLDAGIVQRIDDDGFPVHPDSLDPFAYMLTDRAGWQAERALEFCEAWETPDRRLWLSALVGDWLLAKRLVADCGDPVLIALVAERAAEYRKQRLAIAREILDERPQATGELRVMRELEAEDFDAYVERALHASDVGGRGSVAAFLVETNDPRWSQQVYECFTMFRAHPDRSEGVWVLDFAEFLIKHSYRVEDVLSSIVQCEKCIVDVAVILLKYLPDAAIPVVRRVLRQRPTDVSALNDGPDSCDPETRAARWHVYGPAGKIAAVLAAIDLPWARRELYEALEEVRDGCGNLIAALPCVLALDASGNADARRTARLWKERFDGALLGDVDAAFQSGFSRYRDAGVEIRDRSWSDAQGES